MMFLRARKKQWTVREPLHCGNSFGALSESFFDRNWKARIVSAILFIRLRWEDAVNLPLLALWFGAPLRPFTGMYPPMSSQTGRLEGIIPVSNTLKRRNKEKWLDCGLHTSENALLQLAWSHTWGFSPVCVREWTVRADRWIKLLEQLGKSHWNGRSFVWMRKCLERSDFRLKTWSR